MDYTEYTTVKNRFTAIPNLCDLFKLLSIETWKRIEYACLKSGVKVFETTITQNIIFSINAYNDQYGLNIEILEALDEKTNGNDFELIIRYPQDGLEYYAPIQAKKVYRNGKYNSMEHGVQIQSLMDYANANDATPFYLLYNFTPSPIISGITLTAPMETTGCTLISAEHLYNNHYNRRINRNGVPSWIIPNFYDLNPTHAFPWHELVCPASATDFYQILKKKGVIDSNQIVKVEDLTKQNSNLKQGFYPIDTFTKGENWISIKDLEVQPKEEQTEIYQSMNSKFKTPYDDEKYKDEKMQKASSEKERVYPKFSPKSRIILNKQ